MSREKITCEEQLQRWLAGDSVHRIGDSTRDDECCPDFSCCYPDLLAPFEEREHFVALVQSKGNCVPMLMTFLGRLMRLLNDGAVYMTDGSTRKVSKPND